MNEMVDEMGTGYYEHKIEVKYAEGLLDASKDWQWFIEYTEENFEPDKSFSVFADFQRCFSKIDLVFVHLSRIVDMVGDISVRIEEDWLKNVYGCVRIRCGLADVETMLKGDGFYDVLAVASYATRLICVWQRFSRHFGCPVPTIWQKNRRCLRFPPSRASRPCPSSCSCR